MDKCVFSVHALAGCRVGGGGTRQHETKLKIEFTLDIKKRSALKNYSDRTARCKATLYVMTEERYHLIIHTAYFDGILVKKMSIHCNLKRLI